MTESDKTVMQQALNVLLSYNVEEFGAGQDVVAALRKAIAQPEHPAEPDDLTIAYMSGFADGKKAVQQKGIL